MSTDDSSTEHQISWQSAYWGILALAVNTFLQDPGKVCDNLHDPSPRLGGRIMRLSPFICVIDTLDIAYCLLANTASEFGYSATAASILYQRGLEVPKRNSYGHLENSWIAKIPACFLAFLAVVKFCGMQGLPFTTFCAWAYWLSFVMLEITKVLGSRDSEPDSVTERVVMVQGAGYLQPSRAIQTSLLSRHTADIDQDWLPDLWRRLYWIAYGLQFALMVKVTADMLPDTFLPGDFLPEPKKLEGGFFEALGPVLLITGRAVLYYLAYLLVNLPAGWQIGAILNDVVRLMLMAIFGKSAKISRETYEGCSIWIRNITMICGYLVYFFLAYKVRDDDLIMSKAPAPRWAFAGLICTIFLICCWQLGEWFIKRNSIHSFRWSLNVPDIRRWLGIWSAVALFVLTFYFYAVRYDPTGTYKPSWLESLP